MIGFERDGGFEVMTALRLVLRSHPVEMEAAAEVQVVDLQVAGVPLYQRLTSIGEPKF